MSFAFVYLDDILVASATPADHKKHLKELFALLDVNGININRKKCTFGQEEVRYLGHLVNADGIRPLPARIDDLLQFPAPESKLGVQRFLGMINYYRRFMPRIAETLAPLHAAVTSAGKSKQIVWNGECEEAFASAKARLSKAVLLHHPNPFSATSLTVDASEVAVGAELSQRGPSGQWRPLAFFSHTLTSTEKKYSAFDRELLAIYLSVRNFKHFLEGKPFIIFTDHKPLTYAPVSYTHLTLPTNREV